MDEFGLQIDEVQFRKTNGLWNDLCLNDPWSVGYVSNLIEAHDFLNKEDWEQFYYDSGFQRRSKIELVSIEDKNLLNNHTLKRTNPGQISILGWDIKNINLQFGRTREQLIEKGEILHKYAIEKGIDITVDECTECVRYRTICETWNGIVVRERNTVQKLKLILPNVSFAKTEGDFDHRYAVDYELSENGKIFCGIQIKPKSYTYNAPYLLKARTANVRKNEEYSNTFKRPVFYVISKTSGELEKLNVLDEIKLAMKNVSND